MISEEDKILIEEANKCTDCLCWLKHCNAECCRMIYVGLPVEMLNEPVKYLFVKLHCNLDLVWYYKLHGVAYHHGVLKFLKSKCFRKGNDIVYMRDCSLLKDMKCSGHNTRKPELCSWLNEETACNENGFRLTQNCLYRYKNMETDLDEK